MLPPPNRQGCSIILIGENGEMVECRIGPREKLVPKDDITFVETIIDDPYARLDDLHQRSIDPFAPWEGVLSPETRATIGTALQP